MDEREERENLSLSLHSEDIVIDTYVFSQSKCVCRISVKFVQKMRWEREKKGGGGLGKRQKADQMRQTPLK